MNYYNEIENYIKKNEVNKYARKIDEDNDKLATYWNVGRLIVEAQGGETRAKYGNRLIKEWSIKLTEKYGKGYNYINLTRFRNFYLSFPILSTVSKLSWSLISEILPIKDENKRNYYVNICIAQNLSVRELRMEIKSDSYERLLNKPEKIDIITPVKSSNITDNIKNPIIIELSNGEQINNERDLEIMLLAKLKSFFSQLGEGFTLVGNQYKVDKYFIDILLFNYIYNCFIVVELKNRELKKEDKGQIEFYMKLIDENLRKQHHKNTIGIIITKEQDKFVANFIGTNNIIQLTYEVVNK